MLTKVKFTSNITQRILILSTSYMLTLLNSMLLTVQWCLRRICNILQLSMDNKAPDEFF